MAAALAAGDGVDFVDDDAAHATQHGAPAVGAEQHIQRFGRGDEDVRVALVHRLAFLGAAVAAAHGRADAMPGQAHAGQFARYAFERCLEVEADIVGQRFQRRHVQHAGGVRQRAAVFHGDTDQFVDRRQESGEGLARSGRCRAGTARPAHRRAGIGDQGTALIGVLKSRCADSISDKFRSISSNSGLDAIS